MTTLSDLYRLEEHLTTEELVAAVHAATQEPNSLVKDACVMTFLGFSWVDSGSKSLRHLGRDFPFHDPDFLPGGKYHEQLFSETD